MSVSNDTNLTTPVTFGPAQFRALSTVVDGLVAENESAHNNLNEMFLVVMAVIIFFMQAGFAFLEAGSVRSKNTTNILMKNMVDSCFGGIFYWLFGWAFAFGTPSHPFIGYGGFASPPQADLAFWFFQFVFAATTSTIVSGAVAERCDFLPFVIYSIIMTGFVYPTVSHWAWADNGWLKNIGGDGIGYMDFAGSGVVHVVGGVFAFVGAVALGPRIGRFPKGESAKPIPGHSVTLVSLGGFILMFGFLAFNGGSQASISEDGDGIIVARAMINTIISGSAAAIVAMSVTRVTCGKWSLLVTINGCLTGMVAICAGCDAVYQWGAAAIGASAGLVYILASSLVAIVRVDDPLDAVAVHFGGGFWGVLMRPFFDMNDGIWFNFDPRSGLALAWNVIGLTAIIAWCIIWAIIIFGIMKGTGILRVSPEVEMKGMDIFKHGEPVYPIAAYGHMWGENWENGAKEHPEVEAMSKTQVKPIRQFGNPNPGIYETGVRGRGHDATGNPQIVHPQHANIVDYDGYTEGYGDGY